MISEIINFNYDSNKTILLVMMLMKVLIKYLASRVVC